MSEVDRNQDVLRFYDTALREGRTRHEQVGWESAAVQHLRFEALLEAINHADFMSRVTLLDVGCGMGDLVGWLESTGRPVEYTGIDVHPEMISRARDRWGERDNVRFEVADLLDWEPDGLFDIVLCSGALSIRFDDEETSWRFVERLYSMARWVAALNFQSERAIEVPGAAAQRTDFWHVKPEDVFSRLRRVCRNLVLREDTVPSDIVVWMYRDYCKTLKASRLSELEQAEVFLQRGAHQHALEALAFADLRGDSEEARAAYLGGICHAHLGDEQQAREKLLEAQRLAPDDLDTVESLVHLAIATEDGDEVSRLVDALPGDGPGAAHRDDIRMPLHDLYVAAGRHDQAEALEKEVETEFAQALMRGGRLLAEHRNKEAVEMLIRAVDRAPWDGRPLTLLAAACLRTNQPADALAHVKEALLVSPNSESGRRLGLEAMRTLTRQARRGDVSARAALDEVVDHPVLGGVARTLMKDLLS